MPGKAALFESQDVFHPHVDILRNGRNIHFIDDLGTGPWEGEFIALFPLSAAGRERPFTSLSRTAEKDLALVPIYSVLSGPRARDRAPTNE
jgi:hypothetical protein